MTDPATEHADELVRRYFADPSRTVRLAAGDVLMRQGETNTRLYLVRQGLVTGTAMNGDGLREVMRAGPGDLVGVHSFFSGSSRTAQTMTALEPTTLAYVDRAVPIEPGAPSLERALMPLIVAELLRRQQAVIELAERERETRERLERLERVSALGQLAAGVAHELNNALAVLARGTSWLADAVQRRIDQCEAGRHRAFDAGLSRGRVASAEVRHRARQIERAFQLPEPIARKLAETGLSDGQLQSFSPLAEKADEVFELWELGATIHDMRLAAEQAEHVIRSMRELAGAPHQAAGPVDVNETIGIALKILRTPLESIDVKANLAALPLLRGSRGAFVQVWTNLIKNACEAMLSLRDPARPRALLITSRADDTHVTVTIEDTGPGIPGAVLGRIFDPNFTTKKTGLSFGLGLGLAIVQRLVSEHGGDVAASNTGHGARFTVRLPREVLP